jgi:NADH:ubiquinone oxidoreductase subunit E
MIEIIICVNRRYGRDSVSCAQRGSEAVADALEAEIQARGLSAVLVRIHCFGKCAQGVNLRIAPGGRFFHGVTLGDLPRVLDYLADALEQGGRLTD